MISSVGFIGSGNVATNLALAFQENKIEVKYVFSKSKENRIELAKKLDCRVFDSVEKLPRTDAIFLCVNDDQIELISNQLFNQTSLIVHCSGSVGINALKANKNIGVFYPFQSFKKSEKVKWNIVPILIESNKPDFENDLTQLAKTISSEVSLADSTQRKSLHLSGVLMNNFINHLAVLSNDFLKQNNLDPKLLQALSKQTMDRILIGTPEQFQTGPAVRGDSKTINSHLKILEENPNLRNLYKQFTESIKSWGNNK